MISEHFISETQSGTPSGVGISFPQSPVASESPVSKKLHVKIPLNHPVALYVQSLKATNSDLTTLECLTQCIPKDNRELVYNCISEFLSNFLFYLPEMDQRIQAIDIQLKALVNDKKISEDAGMELIKMLNGDDLE